MAKRAGVNCLIPDRTVAGKQPGCRSCGVDQLSDIKSDKVISCYGTFWRHARQRDVSLTKIGELLCEEGHITRTQLQEALNYQKKNNGRLASILIELGYVGQDVIQNLLSRIHDYPAVDLSTVTPTADVLKLVPYEMAKKYMVFPIRLCGEDLLISMADPADRESVSSLSKEIGRGLTVGVSAERDIVEAYRVYYEISDEEYRGYFGAKGDIDEEEDPVMAVDNGDGFSPEAVLGFESEIQANENEENEEYTAADGAIVTLVNGILERAVNEGMSDIHVEPFEDSLQVRYRLDGILYKSLDLPSDIEYPLTSRLKLLSGLNTRERRAPQDGRFRMRFGKGRPIDFHLSTLPTLHGESVVVRVLNRGVMKVQLAGMGFETKTLETLKRCVSRPQGMILVTGPTDSGKTTTLYNVLNQLNREDVKILTAEDPVEFSFRGISQMHVQEELGMTFSTAVKTFLRQDPDIIMVGEIENPETAKMAIKAAMTGHLVFSTLHTSDGPSTIGRLVDMGIPLYMLASSVKMVLSQRLVRKLCPKCKVLYEAVDPDELESVGFSREDIPGLSIYGPQGCQKCMGTGYRGRIGLYELMEVTDEVGKTIAAGASEDQLRRIAIEEGMVTLREAGLEKIRQGVTSLEEVVMRTVASKEAIPEYLASPVIEHYEDEDSLFQQGDNDADFFMLMQGRLAVVRNGQQLYQIVKPGEYFGLRAAITNAPRSTTVMSKGMSTVRRFPGDKFSEIIVKSPNVAKHLLKTAASRLSRTEDSVVELLQARQGAA